MALTSSKIIPARSSPWKPSDEQAVGKLTQTAKSRRSELLIALSQPVCVATQRRLMKTDATTTKIPVSYRFATRSELRKQTPRCDHITSEKASREKKEQVLVDEAIKYQLDILGLSSTKRPGFGLLNLNGWKLFYSGVDITTRTQAGVGVLVEPNLANRIIVWKPITGRVVILRLKLQQANSITLVQVYAPNVEGEYETFLEEVQCALSEVPNTGSFILIGDLNSHVGVNAEK
ncbi:unnamed protein product [Soboliphyme baturini]|uniref:Endo/exonuclease/phosphatase domain-containing protein n=1 Tax=Soboliphyme baturini TaxID=241478 RepID=A0A183IP75_9BILA|nr:unnamed protein product [Soboliphyme baturini]